MAEKYSANMYKMFGKGQLIAPYVKSAILKEVWPDNLIITDPYFHDSNEDDYFHPSTHALYGAKAIYHKLHPELRKELKANNRMTFEQQITVIMGSVYHSIIQSNLVQQGLVSEFDVEVPMVDDERHWRGHADLVFKGDLADIKSMNAMAFDRVQAPYNSWKYQMAPYMDYRGKDRAIILVVEMGKPWAMKEFIIQRDEILLKEIYDKWARVREALAAGEEPEDCCKPENSMFCPLNCKGELYKG